MHVLEEDDVRIWCSEMGSAPAPSLEGVRAHHAVVRAAMEAEDTLLPMRFGQWFSTRERLRERLRAGGARYPERLRAVRGAHEFGVRIGDPGNEAAPVPETKASTGREHMEALARQAGARRGLERRGRQLADELRQHTDGLVREDRVQTLEPGWGIVSVAHLVDRERTDAYHEGVRRFQEEHGGLNVHLSGPWPPYSFVE